MATEKRFIIPVDGELFKQGKHWAVDSGVTIAAAGRAFYAALFAGDPRALALLDAPAMTNVPTKRKPAK